MSNCKEILEIMKHDFYVEEISKEKYIELTNERNFITKTNQHYCNYSIVEPLTENMNFVVITDTEDNTENGLVGWCVQIVLKIDDKYYIITDAD